MHDLLKYLKLIITFPFQPIKIINSNYETFKYYKILFLLCIFILPCATVILYNILEKLSNDLLYKIIIILNSLIIIILFIDVNIKSAFIKWSGKWFGGSAPFKQIRILYTLTYSLIIYTIPFYLIIFIIGLNLKEFHRPITIIFQILSVILIFIIINKSQNFSKLRTLANVIILYSMNLILSTIIFLLTFSISYIISRSAQEAAYMSKSTETPYNHTYWKYYKCTQGDCVNGKGVAIYYYYTTEYKFIYTGSFKNQKPDGYGEMKISEKQIIKGTWREGKLDSE